MRGVLSFIYGIASYLTFLGVFLYAIAFVGDFIVPKTIDIKQSSRTKRPTWSDPANPKSFAFPLLPTR